jgi:hypothetical protein
VPQGFSGRNTVIIGRVTFVSRTMPSAGLRTISFSGPIVAAAGSGVPPGQRSTATGSALRAPLAASTAAASPAAAIRFRVVLAPLCRMAASLRITDHRPRCRAGRGQDTSGGAACTPGVGRGGGQV